MRGLCIHGVPPEERCLACRPETRAEVADRLKWSAPSPRLADARKARAQKDPTQ